jgi:O-acetyl-ADP-ribose deacetylase (regulator of RNase III)
LQADVLVNTTRTSLELDYGNTSKALVAKAGPGLQQECSTYYPQGIKFGDIAETGGHNLACKKVFHLALPEWSNPQAHQVVFMFQLG